MGKWILKYENLENDFERELILHSEKDYNQFVTKYRFPIKHKSVSFDKEAFRVVFEFDGIREMEKACNEAFEIANRMFKK